MKIKSNLKITVKPCIYSILINNVIITNYKNKITHYPSPFYFCLLLKLKDYE